MMAIDTSTDAMTTLTDAWYNRLASGLNLSIRNFQLLQPPVIPTDDQSLWDCFNVVPPETLKYNRWFYKQPGFFSQYAALINGLSFPDSAFAEDIGPDVYAEWIVYLDGIQPPPAPNTLPTVWLQWAMVHAPSVANVGRADLSAQLLINGGKAALQPYEGPDALPADFLPTFSYLKSTLQASPGAKFSFDSAHDDPDVSNSWVPGDDPNFFGMWTGSSAAFSISKKFASSNITVSASFDHVAVVSVTPGSWYNSGLLQSAYMSPCTPPWTDSSHWDTYFGSDGTLTHAVGSLLAADGIAITLTSDADFNIAELAIISTLAPMGFWPVYCPVQQSVITNSVSIQPGSVTIRMQSVPGYPVILGFNVFKVGSYLGG